MWKTPQNGVYELFPLSKQQKFFVSDHKLQEKQTILSFKKLESQMLHIFCLKNDKLLFFQSKKVCTSFL